MDGGSLEKHSEGVVNRSDTDLEIVGYESVSVIPFASLPSVIGNERALTDPVRLHTIDAISDLVGQDVVYVQFSRIAPIDGSVSLTTDIRPKILHVRRLSLLAIEAKPSCAIVVADGSNSPYQRVGLCYVKTGQQHRSGHSITRRNPGEI